MKLKRFIAASALLFCALRAVACGPGPLVLPSDNDLYRILPYYAELREPDYGRVAANCEAWWEAAPGLSYASIRQAIYDFSLADWLRVQQGDDCGNTLCRHLIDTRDTDAVRLLVWSKYYEQWSEQMRSPWYYGCGSDDGGLDLDSIATTAANYNGRYADRYLLLAMKCLYRGYRNEECEALWKKRKGVMKESHLRDQAEGYLAACLYRMNRVKEAINIYTRIGDAASLQFVMDDKVGVFERVFRHHPNSPFFPIALQRVLFVVENYTVDSRFTQFSLDDSQLRRLLTLATRAGRDPRVNNQALWRYTAACLLDHMGRRREALKQLNGLSSDDEFLDASIHTLRIYLHARLDRIDDRYEQQLFADLKWFDKRMRQEWAALDSNERYRLSHFDGFGYNYDVYRTLYSHDALRRIVFGHDGLVDRFAKAGRTTRAIQLANLTDNYFLQLTENPIIKLYRTGRSSVYYSEERADDTNSYNGYGFSITDIDTSHMDDYYTMGESYFNPHDFSNRLFVHADRMSADALAEYWNHVKEPRDNMDRWFNARAYIDSNYWCDIVGTHLLREMRFAEAADWLSRVESNYQHRLNTEDWMIYNPFCHEERYLPFFMCGNYKLSFAKRMARLERHTGTTHSPNDRADAMLSLSIALKNAFSERCWPLVGYAFQGYDYIWEPWDGELSWDPLTDSYMSPCGLADDAVVLYARQALKRADELRKQAFATYTDPDRKAQGLKRVYEYTYLMEHYAETPTGQNIARHCDQWKDYLIQ